MQIKKHIPNTITAMNLLSGVVAVIFTLEGRLDVAFYLMLLAAAFDFCDGLAARLLHVTSDIGKELDSLSDVVSFGVLPALMLRETMVLSGMTCWLSWVPLSLAAFSALRLAKFNVDTRQGSSFIGLPTPAAAIIAGSLSCLVMKDPDFALSAWVRTACWIIPVLAVVLSLLLVSEIPMFAMKIKKGSAILDMKRTSFLTLCALSLLLTLLLGAHWSLFPLLSFVFYILLNAVFAAFKL